MKIAIAAIAKDEIDYVPEWVAWHVACGFEHFLLADNGSRDGTCEYFEALRMLGLADVLYVPRQTNAQVIGYNQLLRELGHNADLVAFVDLDEFICPNADIPLAKTGGMLRDVFASDDVGAVAINWRIFGSGGHLVKHPEPVTARFKMAASDSRFINRHIKSVVRVCAVRTMHAHFAELAPQFKYVNSRGGTIQFLQGARNQVHSEKASAFSDVIYDDLRVHHYIVKSRQEFVSKKLARGDVNRGDLTGLESYFTRHDINDESCENAFPRPELGRVSASILDLLRAKTPFYDDVVGRVELLRPNFVEGWCVNRTDPDCRLWVKIYVDGVYMCSRPVYRYRRDLIDSGITGSSRAGFHVPFERPLPSGSKVEVRCVANPYVLPGIETI